jgi:HSP90 family molecular chaperone
MQTGAAQFKSMSDASNLYTIVEDGGAAMEGFGTRLVLHLKENALEYLEVAKLEDLLQHSSKSMEVSCRARRTVTLSLGAPRSVPGSSATLWQRSVPDISLEGKKTEYKQVPNKEANTELEEDEDPKMKTVPETTEGYKQINTNKPI